MSAIGPAEPMNTSHILVISLNFITHSITIVDSEKERLCWVALTFIGGPLQEPP